MTQEASTPALVLLLAHCVVLNTFRKGWYGTFFLKWDDGRRDGRGQMWWQSPHVAALQAPGLFFIVGVEAWEPPAQRGRHVPIPRKTRYRLAQQDRTRSIPRGVGPGETHAAVCGGKESRP